MQFRLSVRIALLALFLVLLSSCDSNSSPLAPIQGKWMWDDDRYVKNRQDTAKSEQEFKQFKALYGLMKKAGAPLFGDIAIEGQRITMPGTIGNDQIDLSECTAAGKDISCRAFWQRTIAGTPDTDTVDMILTLTDEGLTISWDKAPPLFFIPGPK